MFSKVAFAVGMMFAATAAQAGIFGSSEKTPTPQELQAQANCSKDHSFAYCTVWASSSKVRVQDVELPENLRSTVSSNGALTQALNLASSTVVGASQLAGSAPTIGSRVGMGSLNIVGGLMMFVGGAPNTGVDDKMIAFLPESEAPNAIEAQRKIDEVYVDAFVKAIPGATAVSYETFQGQDSSFISSYVVHGGECDKVRCVLWSSTWGDYCKTAECPRPTRPARLIKHGYLGAGAFWVPPEYAYVTLVIGGNTSMQMLKSRNVVSYGLEGTNNKLDLMLSVSEHLPNWASYLLAPSTDRKMIPYPMLINGGQQYLFIKPTEKLAAN